MDNYMLLVGQLQRLYPNYQYEIIPVVIGAMGTVPKTLKRNLQRTGIKDNNIKKIITRIQKLALLGTMNIVKTFQKM